MSTKRTTSQTKMHVFTKRIKFCKNKFGSNVTFRKKSYLKRKYLKIDLLLRKKNYVYNYIHNAHMLSHFLLLIKATTNADSYSHSFVIALILVMTCIMFKAKLQNTNKNTSCYLVLCFLVLSLSVSHNN